MYELENLLGPSFSESKSFGTWVGETSTFVAACSVGSVDGNGEGGGSCAVEGMGAVRGVAEMPRPHFCIVWVVPPS